jgi:membrane-associated phospholipid phosphatase
VSDPPLRLVLAALAFGACVVLIFVLTRSVDPVTALDERAFEGLGELENSASLEDEPLQVATRAVNPLPFAVLLAALCLYGLRSRRPGLTVAAAFMVVGANLSTQLLKSDWAEAAASSLLRIDPGLPSFPSGHATGAMSLAVAAVLVAPHGRRLLVGAGGGLFVLAQAVSMLALGWHRPSDVVAAYAMVGAWTCLVLGALIAARRWRAGAAHPLEGMRPALRRTVIIAAVLGAALLAITVAVVGPRDTLDFAADNTLGVLAGAVVASAAVLGPMVVAALLPGPPRRVR